MATMEYGKDFENMRVRKEAKVAFDTLKFKLSAENGKKMTHSELMIMLVELYENKDSKKLSGKLYK